MPRGGGRAPKKNYKGRSRHFTDEETLNQQMEKEERERQWRKQRGDDVEEEDEKPENRGGARGGLPPSDSESSSEESESDEERGKKGVSHLIEIENPNRAVKKTQKLSNLDDKAKGPQLSRREREELEKQQAKERYNKMHMEGKTDEARSDLARLAIIRKQREEAAKKREEERLEREAAEAAAKKS